MSQYVLDILTRLDHITPEAEALATAIQAMEPMIGFRRSELQIKCDDAIRDAVAAGTEVWRHCVNCGEELQWPGHCQKAHAEEVQGLNRIVEETLTEVETLRAEVRRLHAAIETAA